MAAGLAVLPAFLIWRLYAPLLRRLDDPVLPERLASRRLLTVGILIAGVGIVAGIWPRWAIWTVPLAVIGYFRAIFGVRRILLGENLTFSAFLLQALRILAALKGFWLLLAFAPGIIFAAGNYGPLVALVLGLTLVLWHWRYTDALLRIWRARPLEREDLAPRFAEIVDKTDLAPPRVWQAGEFGSVFANAFALASLRGASVLFTRTLLERLTTEEIVAIYGHEIAHLEYFKPARLHRLFVLTLVQIVAAITLVPLLTMTAEQLVPVAALLWPVVIALTLMMHGSSVHANELASDRRAVELCGNAEALATGLAKVHAIARLPARWDAQANVHPSLARRVRAIHEIAGQGARLLTEPVVIEGAGPGVCVLFEPTMMRHLTGVPPDAPRDPATLASHAADVQRFHYAHIATCRIVAHGTQPPELLVVDRQARRFAAVLRDADVPRIQDLLDTIEHQLTPRPPASFLDNRLVAALTGLLALAAGPSWSVMFVAALAVVRPATDLVLAAIAMAAASGLLGLVNPVANATGLATPGLQVIAAVLLLALLLRSRIVRSSRAATADATAAAATAGVTHANANASANASATTSADAPLHADSGIYDHDRAHASGTANVSDSFDVSDTAGVGVTVGAGAAAATAAADAATGRTDGIPAGRSHTEDARTRARRSDPTDVPTEDSRVPQWGFAVVGLAAAATWAIVALQWDGQLLRLVQTIRNSSAVVVLPLGAAVLCARSQLRYRWVLAGALFLAALVPAAMTPLSFQDRVVRDPLLVPMPELPRVQARLTLVSHAELEPGDTIRVSPQASSLASGVSEDDVDSNDGPTSFTVRTADGRTEQLVALDLQFLDEQRVLLLKGNGPGPGLELGLHTLGRDVKESAEADGAAQPGTGTDTGASAGAGTRTGEGADAGVTAPNDGLAPLTDPTTMPAPAPAPRADRSRRRTGKAPAAASKPDDPLAGWTMRLPDFVSGRLSVDPRTGRWRVVGYDTNGHWVRVQGVLGNEIVEEARWNGKGSGAAQVFFDSSRTLVSAKYEWSRSLLGRLAPRLASLTATLPSAKVSLWRTEAGPALANGQEPDGEVGARLASDLSRMAGNRAEARRIGFQRTAAAQTLPGRTTTDAGETALGTPRPLVDSAADVSCHEPEVNAGTTVCLAYDGVDTRIWSIDAEHGTLMPVGLLHGYAHALSRGIDGSVLVWLGRRPLIVHLRSPRAVELALPPLKVLPWHGGAYTGAHVVLGSGSPVPALATYQFAIDERAPAATPTRAAADRVMLDGR